MDAVGNAQPPESHSHYTSSQNCKRPQAGLFAPGFSNRALIVPDQYRNTLLALGIALGLVSIPLTWLVADAVRVEGLAEIAVSAFETAVGEEVNTVEVTGRDGTVNYPITAPLWLLVCIAVGAGVLQLMRGSEMFAVPLVIAWIVALAGCAWIAGTIIHVLRNDTAEVAAGAWLGLASSVIPVVCLLIPSPKREATE